MPVGWEPTANVMLRLSGRTTAANEDNAKCQDSVLSRKPSPPGNHLAAREYNSIAFNVQPATDPTAPNAPSPSCLTASVCGDARASFSVCWPFSWPRTYSLEPRPALPPRALFPLRFVLRLDYPFHNSPWLDRSRTHCGLKKGWQLLRYARPCSRSHAVRLANAIKSVVQHHVQQRTVHL